MLGNILPPYHSLQELNLDWILTKVKNILRFVPDDGAVGQILRRTAYGAEWSDEQGAGGSVTSVNGQQGAVVLDAADVGALPDTTVIPDSTSDLINDSGFVDAAGAAAAAPVQSVNGQTGAVSISIPDSTSDLVNDSGFVNAAGAAAAAPVQSVNGQTGAVSLSIPDSTSDLINDSGFVNAAGAASAAPVQSVNGQTGDVVISFASPTYTQDNDQASTTGTFTKNYTVSGDGYIFISVSTRTDNTSDFGTVRASILKNGNIVAFNSIRPPSAISVEFGACASVAIPVENGDIITAEFLVAKAGTKWFYRNFLCFGCTIS